MELLAYAPVAVLAALAAAAGACFAQPGRRPAAAAVTEAAAVIAIAGALAAAASLVALGPRTILLAGTESAGVSLRIDAVSVISMALIAFVGAVVLRFSRSYLDGEAREGAFLGWMCATLTAVLTFALAGHLLVLVAAWIAMSVFLTRLLLFYPERPAAQRAARKKAAVARLGDASLIGAALALWFAYGTGDLHSIAVLARAGDIPPGATIAALLLALAAILKSAQAPAHGWLIEVMEAPTPVSALLHAGVINAGGLLLIRFADVLVGAPGVLAMLVMIGGFTALFGSLVMLTQPAVKTSLAWSTVAQMGFMIFQCGLALFPLALLHIVAHSLYKAHAFLSSGGAVERVASIRRPGPVAIPGPAAVVRAFAVALLIYALASFAFGFEGKSPQAIALGAILIFGVAYLLAQGFADKAPKLLTRYTAFYSLLTASAYFALQELASALLTSTLPQTPPPGPLEWALILLALVSFGLVAVVQAAFPLWSGHPAAAGLRVHLTNGLYLNALTDRLLGSWTVKQPRNTL